MKKWAAVGMNIKNFEAPIVIANPNKPGNVKAAMIQAFTESNTKFKTRCQLLVCIIDKQDKGLYENIKKLALCEAGLITQCMLSKNVLGEIKDQYITNVALKVYLFNIG